MRREIAHRSRRPSSRSMSSLTRPYTFHIGASWVGKPVDPNKIPRVPFPSDSLIGGWRDKTLLRSKVAGNDAGEDFFYVQEVSL
jgi:protein phosphatase PTC7